ncbi:MAG: M1 family metallopeptidase [Burkholderiales bacterium]
MIAVLSAPVRLLLAALLVVLVSPAAAYAQPGPAAVPGMRLPRNVEALDYDVHLSVDPAESEFSGAVGIALRVLEPTDLVWLNAKGLALREITAAAPGGEAIAGTLVQGSDDVVGVSFPKVLPAGEVRLAFRYTGTQNRLGSIGLFRQEENGHWYAVTQFEPQDARRAIPCFDEPDRKATWKLTLTVPGHMRAFANMPVESERAVNGGTREVVFHRSPPLPSYLVAFAVGEFDVVDGGRAGMKETPISIVVPKGRAGEAEFAAARTGAILAATERYFGTPYPFPKLDLLAYPKAFFGSAMENPGLITYSARGLLAKPEEMGPLFEQRFTGITAHEIAHMWFGDYVTMAWWDDLWLNESFASWLGTKVYLEVSPQATSAWRSYQRTQAIDADQLPAARALRQPVDDPRDIRAAFDAISYAKGETLLAMFEQWLGPAKFRDGVRSYVAKHAWSNATAHDFFSALGSSDEAVVPAFRAFAGRPGVPLLDVALECKGTPTLSLAQQRFVPVGAAAEASEPWVFPACFDVGDGQKSRQVCTVVRDAKQSLALPPGPCPQWVVANRSGIGYYLPRLSPALYEALPKADRVLAGADWDPLLGDLGILARGGAVRYDVALRVAARQAASADTRAASRAYALARSVPAALVDASNQERYAAWIRRYYGDRARALGWLPQKGETADILRLRESAVELVAVRGQDVALARKAQQLTQRWIAHRSAIPAESRRTILVAAARTTDTGAARLFDALHDIATTSKDTNEREDVYRALGAFADPALLDRALTPLSGGNGPSRFALTALEQALEGDATRALALTWIAGHPGAWAGIPSEQYGAMAYRARDACTARERAQFVAAFETKLAASDGGARRYRSALERIDQCLALRAAQQAAFNAFVAR